VKPRIASASHFGQEQRASLCASILVSTPNVLRLPDGPVAGMVMGFAAYSLFSVHDTLVKLVVADIPVVQVLIIRSLMIASVSLAMGRMALLADLVATKRKWPLFWRATTTLAAWCLYYVNGTQLKLAEMTTLYYFAPVITLVLAIIFLKERLTLPRTLAALLGFAGVVVACNPSGISLGLPALMVLAAATLWSVAMILMRSISKSETSLLLIFSLNAFYVVVLAPFVLADPRPMGLFQIAAVLGTGVTAGVAQYVLVEAARRVPASVLGTVEYSALIWSFILGAMVFGEMPAPIVFAGAGLIVLAGLTLAWSERTRRVRPRGAS
jgi:drug/metabolite transporter (DMT)-like permease